MRLAIIAVAAVLVRLPFRLRADRFFDADEAVEGLMARHLGDHSLFLWGQGYKGTPEVFLTGALFQLAGPSVIALKAVTLVVFVAFLLLNFVLVERVFSRRNARAGAAAALLLGLFGVQQIAWYTHLQPDAESARAIACLDRAGIHEARAGYWQSYKITFLTNERIVVAPADGRDRYAPYTLQTRDAPRLETMTACQ